MIIVATATSKEMKAAFGFADAPSVEQGEAVEFTLNGRELLLTVTGVGLVNAAIAAGRLFRRPGLGGVVNLGIAGAYEVIEFPLASTCYAWRETWPEYGLLDDSGRVDPKAIGFAQGHIDGNPIWNKLKLNPTKDVERLGFKLSANWLRASSVTVGSVTGTAERSGWLKTACGGDVENMEGFSLAFGAMQQGLPFLEIRTISNLVGSRYAEEWDLKGAFSALGTATAELFK